MGERFLRMLDRFLRVFQCFLGMWIGAGPHGFLQMFDRLLFVRNAFLGMLDDFFHMILFFSRRDAIHRYEET